MKVEAHIIAYNESEVIALTIKHYLGFCSRVVIYDNYSTDNTREIALSLGAEVVPFGIEGVLSDDEYIKVKNNVWKGSDADWVIVCDTDEIIWHDQIKDFLWQHIGKCSMIRTYGWQIMSYDMPKESFLEITNGFHYENYSKFAVFDPKMLTEISYVVGCHDCRPQGKVIKSEDFLYLLHYSNIGGPERLIKKHASYRPRLSERNLRWGMGIHYTYTDEQRVKEWKERYEKSKILFALGTT